MSYLSIVLEKKTKFFRGLPFWCTRYISQCHTWQRTTWILLHNM